MCDICAEVPDWLSAKASEKPATISQSISRTRAAAEPPTVAELSAEDRELFALLAEWRLETARADGVPAFVVLGDATVADLCRMRPESVEELPQVFGIGARKAEKYGEAVMELLGAFAGGRRAKPKEAKENTVAPSLDTLELLNAGRSIAEIAALRGRQVATIVERVAVLLDKGRIAWQPEWVPAGREAQIREVAGRVGLEKLKPIKEALPSEITYDDIRLVVADMRRNMATTAGPDGPPSV